MRLSLLCSLASILAMTPIQGSGEHVGGVSFRSSLDTPSLFAVRKTPQSLASKSVFEITRGGTAPTTNAKVATKRVDVSDIFSKEKIGWTISLGINLLYLYFFFARLNQHKAAPTCDFYPLAFCVTNYDKANKTCPPAMNSHTWAFIVDCIYTYLGIKAPTTKGSLYKGVLIFAILSHGSLHAALGIIAKCGGGTLPGAMALFGGFATVISYSVVSVTGSFGLVTNLLLAAVCGLLTVVLSGPDGSNGVSSIFLITQLAASLVVSITPKKQVPITDIAKIGNSFVYPCIISLIEFLFCCGDSPDNPGFFNRIGGHVWYDIFLHRSILFAISDGVESNK